MTSWSARAVTSSCAWPRQPARSDRSEGGPVHLPFPSSHLVIARRASDYLSLRLPSRNHPSSTFSLHLLLADLLDWSSRSPPHAPTNLRRHSLFVSRCSPQLPTPQPSTFLVKLFAPLDHNTPSSVGVAVCLRTQSTPVGTSWASR